MATHKQMRKELTEMALAEGADSVEVTYTKRGHFCVRMFVGDQSRVVHQSGSPSDHRAQKNLRSQIRHTLYDMGAIHAL